MESALPAPRTEQTPHSRTKMLLAAGAGHAVDAFDFLIFSLFAVYLSKTFFPPENETLAMINTTATFALSFFFRPLGGLIFGKIADRRGRRPAMMATVFLMAGASPIMALLPGQPDPSSASPPAARSAIPSSTSTSAPPSAGSAATPSSSTPPREARFSSDPSSAWRSPPASALRTCRVDLLRLRRRHVPHRPHLRHRHAPLRPGEGTRRTGSRLESALNDQP